MLKDTSAIATIPVKDVKKAKAFYADKLGFHAIDERPEVTTYQSGPSVIFVYKTMKAGTNNATAATWVIDDVDKTVRELKAKGVAFEHYDDLPGMKVQGDVHTDGDMKAAWFKDPDGNILAIVNGG